MARMSIATIDKPEFINVTPYNPLISQCEIKVMYIGENRNRSYITKEVATEMANTLPGCPIVGYFKEEKQDFADHGDRVIFDDEGMHFECMTRPYGFVAPDAKVWFQKFEELDENGKRIIREYLMTNGFLWTGQYPECQSAVEGDGKPHSMELDEDTLDGQWTKNYKKNIDFFIINDAIFSKLCILGDDVEPCFEGSSVTAPNISASFTKVDEKFTHTLFTMMQELKTALKGEQEMSIQDKFEKDSSVEFEKVTEESVQTSFAASDKKEEEDKEKETSEAKTSEDKKDEEDKEKKEKFAKEEDKEEKEKVEDKKEESSEDKKEEDEEKEEKKKFSLLEGEFSALQEKYSALESQYNELLTFKNQIEDEKKDALIKSFYMLSDEDKKEVVENKAKYSLEDIEAKLSVICVRKKVNFDLEDTDKIENKTEQPVTTFSLEEQVSSAPAWIAALKNTQKSRSI